MSHFNPDRISRLRYVVKQVIWSLGLVVLVVVLMLYLLGTFRAKIKPEPHTLPPLHEVGDRPLVPVRRVEVPLVETAVGTIRPVYEMAVASKLLARVVEINVTAGQAVQAGQVLVRLDDAELRARLQQAQAALNAATAARDQAKVELDRVEQLLERGVATRLERDRYLTAFKTAQAQVEQAQQVLAEVQSLLEYATIRSPINGIVTDKLVNSGDLAAPGQVLLTLYDPSRMQLLASVRESLAYQLQVGQEMDVRIDAIGETCRGWISEIVPEAQAASRTFLVKVTGPCHPRVLTGMFGRLVIPLGSREALAVPKAAVRQVGQIHLVDVVVEKDGRRVLQRRIVQLGPRLNQDDLVEVLAGLKEGEEVALPKEEAGVQRGTDQPA